MTDKFWKAHSIKQVPTSNSGKKTPSALIRTLREGRVDVSKMSQPELATHMSNEAKLLRNIREASGLPAIRPTQSEFDNPQPTDPTNFNLADTAVTPPDATRVARRKP